TTARAREKRSSGSQRCPKNYWCRSRRLSISAISPASHSLATDHCSRATAFVLWLRFRRPGSGTDDSTSSGNELCVDSGLASWLIRDSRRLPDQQADQGSQQRLTTLPDVVDELEEAQVQRQFFLRKPPVRAE